MVSRTWSARLNTSIGSSAASGPRSAVEIGSPNSMSHFDGSGTAPSGPSSGNVGVTGKYGMFQQPGQRRDVGDLGVGLLGPDDRARDDRLAGAQRRRDEAAAAEPLQLVPVGERLADPLEALRAHADEFAVGQQALRVRVAGQRAAVLAAELADDRHPEHQVGAEHAQVPVRRMMLA